MNIEDDINLLKAIYTAVINISGVKYSKLTYNTAINNDLHIYGDDVDEILIEINQRYPFPWQTFPFSDYFASEVANLNHFTGFIVRLVTLPLRIIWWAFSKKYGSALYEAFCDWVDRIDAPRLRTPFTIGHLFAFVREQAWSDNLTIPQHLAEIDKLVLSQWMRGIFR